MLTACPSCGRRNPVGAKFCSECGAGLTPRAAGSPARADDGVQPQGRPEASGERRQLTIMFCDLVGSTTFASRLDPEDTREVIGASLRMVTDVVKRHGGYTARYIGDGALVYFGYPHAHEDDAERAIQAGLQIIEEAASLTLLGDLRPQFRVGIATGLVVVGDIVRAGATGERDVVGETPHLAARLQTLAEPGSVVISHSTRQLAGGLFSYRDLGGVALKGFAEPVQAYRVLGTTGAESRFEALRGKEDSPLIGRDAELDTLVGYWRPCSRSALRTNRIRASATTARGTSRRRRSGRSSTSWNAPPVSAAATRPPARWRRSRVCWVRRPVTRTGSWWPISFRYRTKIADRERI